MRTTLSFVGTRRARRPEHPSPSRVTRLDQAVERWVAPRRTPALDRVFYPLSAAADHGLLWLAVGAARAAVSPRHRGAFLRLAGAMAAESGLTNGVVKSFFRRVRPDDPHEGLPLPYGMRRPITSAFPSGHAASAFTAATLLAEDDRAAAPAYYALAATVAASRVYVRMHHASDVVAGTAWGLVLGRAIRKRYPLRRPGVSLPRVTPAGSPNGARRRRGRAGRSPRAVAARRSGTA